LGWPAAAVLIGPALADLEVADHAVAAARDGGGTERTYRAYVTGAVGAALLGPRIA
jgi:hypothetical protein